MTDLQLISFIELTMQNNIGRLILIPTLANDFHTNSTLPQTCWMFWPTFHLTNKGAHTTSQPNHRWRDYPSSPLVVQQQYTLQLTFLWPLVLSLAQACLLKVHFVCPSSQNYHISPTGMLLGFPLLISEARDFACSNLHLEVNVGSPNAHFTQACFPAETVGTQLGRAHSSLLED